MTTPRLLRESDGPNFPAGRTMTPNQLGTEGKKSSTNSELGSYHNIHTLLARVLHIGEYLKDKKPNDDILKEWGISLYDTAKELFEAYKQSSSPSLEGLISHWAGRLNHVSTLLQRDDFIGIDRTVALTLKKTITDFLFDLRQLPSIKEGWIDVKKQRPEIDEYVLLYSEETHQYYVEAMDKDDTEDYFLLTYKITHWQPLPSPPAKQL